MKAELIDNRIIVWNILDSRKLFTNGHYGKPIGMPKPKPEEIDVPLILDLIEGYYLLEKNKIKITSSKIKIDTKKMHGICNDEYYNFDKKYQVYKNLRENGYIVNPGIKFGCDFAVYEKPPGRNKDGTYHHAPYLVQVYNSGDSITTTEMILVGRLASTVRKEFVLAIPRAKHIDFIALERWKA